METKPSYDLRSIAGHFQFPGEFVSAEPCGTGHINDTYCTRCSQGGNAARYVLQRINHDIFKDPFALMENVQRVSSHLAAKVAHLADRSRRVLTLVPTSAGHVVHVDDAGNYWRAFLFIDQAHTHDTVESTSQAFEAAKAFGQFQTFLSDLPAPRLHETIPDFHHTPKRFAALENAIEADVAGRAINAKPEIAFALARKSIASALLNAGLPERVTHNDTKFNNVMLDDATGEGICVLDLDTVMPGLALYDFGDMVRSTTSPAKEDERDLSKVTMQFPMFEALVRGYIASAGEFLTKPEKQLLACSGRLIAFETGIRFLTDYLSGDKYFKIHRDGHNLDRCRTQFKLVESMEQQESGMNKLVQTIG